MQKESYPGTFQGHQHPQTALGNPKDKDPKNNQKGDYLSLPVPPHKLHQCIRR